MINCVHGNLKRKISKFWNKRKSGNNMYNKDKICIEIDNMEKYDVIYGKIIKHCELWIVGQKDL